ncbi:hypothetical protein CANARDRAFT_30316 [[Candida] arabinofermentans NRRL YB-2248]|uniref:MHF histone-fold complex subunit 1 n=1 Tax=[Candida] arabinofermentans NRRL YB-2248 TaxID=983967 RepID=A0A1E4SUB0_9ASCO|nr:hypothetical protein CANARDRAFT_30316 [[Candida] arabinofermentans NRRL YB-2248]
MKTLSNEEKEIAIHLKANIWYIISQQMNHEVSKLASTPLGKNVTVTTRFTAALVELVYRQLITLGEDLELFANHAGRTTITPDDMYMIVRKNDALSEILKEYLVEYEENERIKNQG